MADSSKRVDEQVRLAVEALPAAPVRWDRVARRARRRRWIVLVGVLLAGIALGVFVATVLIAGKSALDPSYSPPLVSGAGVSAEFKEPAYGHGLTPLSKFHPELGAETDGLRRSSLGYVFEVAMNGDLGSEPLTPRWRIRRRGSSEALPLSVLPGAATAAHRERSRNETFTAWIEKPARAGQFVVDFALMSGDGLVARKSSAPIHVVTRGLLVPYSAPSYIAGLPRGWRVVADYNPEPGHRFVTKSEGPDGMSILIDTTPDVSGDPADSAYKLESLLKNGEESYRRIDFSRHVFGGPAFEWSYEVGSRASTDVFFYRGHDGFAVLAQSPAERFRESRLIARSVTRSLRTKR